MSRNYKSKSAALFFVLMAALAFNLSSLPGQKAEKSSELSSNSDCDLADQLQLSDKPSAACHFQDSEGTVSGTVRLERVKATVHNWEKDGAATTETHWVLSMDCAECGGVRAKPFSDLREAAAEGKRWAAERIAESKKALEKAAAEKEKTERCEIENGKELTDSSAILKCKVGRLSKISDREKQAQYFQENIQGELQAMLTCDATSSFGGMMNMNSMSLMNNPMFNQVNQQCTVQRQKAMAMLGQLGKYQSNPYIGQVMMDMQAFGKVNEQIQVLNSYMQLPQNDPRRQQASQALQSIQGNWGGYFAMRGMQIQALRTPLGWDDFALNANLQNDLNGFNAAFNQIAPQHQRLLDQSQGNTGNTQFAQNQVNGGVGRGLPRGQVSTSYSGGPGGMASNGAFNNGALPLQQGGSPLQGNRAGVPPMQNAPMRPLNGSSIIKPQLGAPVR
jgi:hypothetical protein